MATGSIRVQTENIFPIIKKFLYSDHEIFLRELVSNAVDASQKLKTLAGIGEYQQDLGELRVEVSIDEQAKTLTISDRGIGMTEQEVEKYINQVAFSGAEEFLQKYKGQNEANIIGHFGLGFYSAFMVSDRVELHSKSFKDEPSIHWECDGSPEYSLLPGNRQDRGTDVVLHLNEESQEFLQSERIEHILNRFCRFLPVPIYFQGKQINNTKPAWTKKPSDLTTQDYQDFYKELYPGSEPPLFWIHLNVDYPFNLTGILYFPKIRHSYEMQKDRISLYCNQVFVTDEVKDIVPEFLMLLHGVIDSPDIPLNVSRSYLQGDPNVKKINGHITKKVADKLDEMFKADRKEFEGKWEHVGLFVKYGMLTDDKFLDKARKFWVAKDAVTDSFYTLEEYREKVQALQTDKEGTLVILYASDSIQQDSFIQAAVNRGFTVVMLDSIIDPSFIQHMEYKWEKVRFTRIDAKITDHLIDTTDSPESVLTNDEVASLKEIFGKQISETTVQVDFQGLSADGDPIIATRDEFMRRMRDMSALSGSNPLGLDGFPDTVHLTVNSNHPICQHILREANSDKQAKMVRNLVDLGLLSQGALKGAPLTEFIKRSVDLLSETP